MSESDPVRDHVVATEETLDGLTRGPVTVRPDALLTVSGTHEGPIELESGAQLRIVGVLRGSVAIGSLATATVSGDLEGAVEIRVAGTLVVEPEGRVAGTVSNFGSFTNRGLRAGRVEGRAPDDLAGAVDIPVGRPDGPESYRLPAR